VAELGLQSTLVEYKVPREDFKSIASQALGREDDPQLTNVIELLESINEQALKI
jgi:hypothetical protein